MKRLFCLFLLNYAVSFAASISQQSTLGAWNSAVTGATVIDFEGVYAPGTGNFQPGGQVTVGGMNIQALNSSGRLYWTGPGGYGPTSNLTTQPLVNGLLDAFLLTPGAPKTAIGVRLGRLPVRRECRHNVQVCG